MLKRASSSFGNRFFIVLGLIVIWVGVIVFRLVDLQMVQNESLKTETTNLHHTIEDIPAIRGEIIDTNGKVFAMSQMEPFVFADPFFVEEPEQTVRALARTLKKDHSWVQTKTKQLSNKKKRFYYIAKRITESQYQKLRSLKLKGIHFQQNVWRKYPKDWLASHVVGFSNQDGSVQEGIERYFHQDMSGVPGKREVMRDGKRRHIGLNSTVLKKPVMGANVQLTIDENIQLFVENALRRAYQETAAKNITAIVMNPRTGAIQAIANMPDFNPNRYGKYSSFDRKNRAIVDVYEPASAFKIITVAAAIDAGAIQMDDTFYCENGGIRVYDKYIRDHERFKTLSVAEILWHSSNVGSIKIAQAMPEETFYRYIQAFGFGSKTGIKLPAEAAGILRPFSEWSKVSHAFLAIGHEISATPLQVLRAASAVANGGWLVKPYIVERIVSHDGSVRDLRPRQAPVRVLKASTAAVMVGALKGVVDQGTAKQAQIPEIAVFGKTGTAQRLQGGSYSRKKFNASFVGFFPAENPQYGIIVVAHDPQGKVHGGEVAAPIFSDIGKHIVLYDQARFPSNELDIPAGAPNWPTPTTDTEPHLGIMPEFLGLGLRQMVRRAQYFDIELHIEGHGVAVRQEPMAGAPIPDTRLCNVYLKED